MSKVQGTAFARVGLLGNPSDGYGGKAIAATLRNFSAAVSIEPAERLEVEVDGRVIAHASLRELCSEPAFEPRQGAGALLLAALRRFGSTAREIDGLGAADPRLCFRVRYRTSVPRQVGLAGSSAIIVAALRALATWFGLRTPPADLAELALAAEVEELGIAAGPMDRVVQAYEGVVHMDLRPPRSPASYTRLDPGLLPPLFVSYDPRGGRASGTLHAGVRERFERGDADVRDAMVVFARLVDEGLACLAKRDLPGLRRLVDLNFDTRAAIFPLSERDHEMVRIGRGRGAATKLCGSGGAVVGIPADDERLADLARAYEEAGYRMVRPELGDGAGP